MGQLISMGACPFCGSGNKTPCFATYDDGFHCYSCGKHKSLDKKYYAYKPQIASNTNNTTFNPPEMIKRPCDFGVNVLKWLYNYYVFDEMIVKYGIGYCSYREFGKFKGESVILPYYEDGSLVFLQQRFFPDKIFRTMGVKDRPFTFLNEESSQIILVEDFISAIRVAEHHNVLCLQGTKLNYNALKYILESNLDIKIWLDPDNAGQEGAKCIFDKVVNYLKYKYNKQAFVLRKHRTVSVIVTDKQPKNYSDQQIKDIIQSKT